MEKKRPVDAQDRVTGDGAFDGRHSYRSNRIFIYPSTQFIKVQFFQATIFEPNTDSIIRYRAIKKNATTKADHNAWRLRKIRFEPGECRRTVQCLTRSE